MPSSSAVTDTSGAPASIGSSRSFSLARWLWNTSRSAPAATAALTTSTESAISSTSRMITPCSASIASTSIRPSGRPCAAGYSAFSSARACGTSSSRHHATSSSRAATAASPSSRDSAPTSASTRRTSAPAICAWCCSTAEAAAASAGVDAITRLFMVGDPPARWRRCHDSSRPDLAAASPFYYTLFRGK